MSAFTTWVVSGWIHLIIGFVLGWIVMKRPRWFQEFLDNLIGR